MVLEADIYIVKSGFGPTKVNPCVAKLLMASRTTLVMYHFFSYVQIENFVSTALSHNNSTEMSG